jgi:hypothetical protein
MSSTNNLKQIGLAAHNYHDTNGRMPLNGNATTTDTTSSNYNPPPNGWCWAYVTLPFIEQGNVYGTGTGQPANVGIKTYLCPGRNHTPYSTDGGNGSSGNTINNNGPHTDYAVNWNTFQNSVQNGPFKLTMTVITSGNGTSNTIYVGEKSMDPNNYGNTYSNNWDEVIYSGGYGGTGRGGTLILRDTPGDNYGNDWGSPFAGGCPFVMCDGSVRMINYSLSGSNAFNSAMYYNNGTVFSLDP